MGLVADELGISGPDAHDRTREALLAVAPELWIGAARRVAEPEPEVELEPEPEVESEPEPEAEQQPEPEVEPASADQEPQRSGGLILLALVLAGALVVVLFLADSGDQPADRTVTEQTAPDPADEPAPEPTPAPPEEANPDRPATTAGELAPLPGIPPEGSAVVSISEQDGERSVTVELEGLRDPRGVYELWLFTSLIESQPLGRTDSGNGEITAALPPDAESYASLDLSFEESAGDPRHSGRSVRRAPLAQLLEAGG